MHLELSCLDWIPQYPISGKTNWVTSAEIFSVLKKIPLFEEM